MGRERKVSRRRSTGNLFLNSNSKKTTLPSWRRDRWESFIRDSEEEDDDDLDEYDREDLEDDLEDGLEDDDDALCRAAASAFSLRMPERTLSPKSTRAPILAADD